MSDTFLMIIPEGWTEIENPEQYYPVEAFQQFISQDLLYEITNVLLASGALQEGYEVIAANAFNDGVNPRVLIKVRQELN